MGITSVAAGGNSPEKCNYDLGGSTGEAEVKIKFKDALPNTLYTVWIDRRKRGLLNVLSLIIRIRQPTTTLTSHSRAPS